MNKNLIMRVMSNHLPLFSTDIGSTLDRLADKLIAAENMHSHYLFRAIEMLTEAEYCIAVFCEGDPIEENASGGADIINDPEKIFELTQAVDDCHLVMFNSPEHQECGWVYITNCNEQHESIADYTCGDRSTFSPLLDTWMTENDPDR